MRDIADEVLDHLRVLERALGVHFEEHAVTSTALPVRMDKRRPAGYVNVTAMIFARVRADHDLRLPHRKIIDVLADKIDFVSGEFCE